MSLVVKRYTASWCVPCKTVGPIIEKIKPQFSGVQFVTIDVDSGTSEVEKHNIRSVPTVILEKDGKEVDRLSGVQSQSTYIQSINAWK